MKIMYVRQVGNQVGLYDTSNREYCRVNGKLVSYTFDFVIVCGGIFTTQLTNLWKDWKTKKNRAQNPICLFWQGHLCNSRTDFIHELLLFGKDIKTFLNKVNIMV